MVILKAWPNLQFLGPHRKVEMNVFSNKLDHAMDFSRVINDKLIALGIPPEGVIRTTKTIGINGLVVTNFYELHYRDEDAIVANLILAEDLGYISKRGW